MNYSDTGREDLFWMFNRMGRALNQQFVEPAEQSTFGNLSLPDHLSLHIVSLPADLIPSCSPRSSRGYQWISSINGLQSQEPGIQGQTCAAFRQLQSKIKYEVQYCTYWQKGWALLKKWCNVDMLLSISELRKNTVVCQQIHFSPV